MSVSPLARAAASATDGADAAGIAVVSAGDGKRDCGADEIADRGDAVPEKAVSSEEVTMSEVTDVPEAMPADVPEVEVVRARAIWEEVVRGIGASATALFDRIDALTDPERVEEANMLAAWREKYENEITARTKFRWWTKKLWKRSG